MVYSRIAAAPAGLFIATALSHPLHAFPIPYELYEIYDLIFMHQIEP